MSFLLQFYAGMKMYVAEHMVILVFFNEIWATAVGDEA